MIGSFVDGMIGGFVGGMIGLAIIVIWEEFVCPWMAGREYDRARKRQDQFGASDDKST